MVDWPRVLELQEDLGAGDFEEVTQLFLEEVEERLAALSGGASATIAEDLHFLKGSAANLGFDSFRDMCEALEVSGDASAIPALVTIYERSKVEFLGGLTTRLAGYVL